MKKAPAGPAPLGAFDPAAAAFKAAEGRKPRTCGS